MNTLTKSTPAGNAVVSPKADAYIGIDYHKRYSVYHAVDLEGRDLAKGRIEHYYPQDFITLVKRWPKCRVVFETSMNWHWLYEVLERGMDGSRIVLANSYKTRIIAEAQVKTDKVDARILAQLLRADLICCVHIPCKATRQRKEVLRQRCFFVRQRTMLRNRIHRLLGAQHDLQLPQCSDLFGKRGLGFLEKLRLPAPAGLLLKQQLEMLKSLQLRVKEDECALSEMMQHTPALAQVRSLPGMGPILAAVVVNEIDDISRFPSAQKLSGYAGLCPSTSSSGGKTYNGKLMRACNKWLRWGFVEAAWVAIGCSPYFGDLYKRKRAAGKKANTAILCVARRMCRITWQLLTQGREYENIFSPPSPQGQPACDTNVSAGLVKGDEGREYVLRAAAGSGHQKKNTFPSRSKRRLVGSLAQAK